MAPIPLNAIAPLGLDAASSPLATAPTAPTAPGAGVTAPTGPAGMSFQGMLADRLNGVIGLQDQANAAAQAVASGRSSDLAGATVAVEKASIALELTGAIRSKAIEAYQEIMRMQV